MAHANKTWLIDRNNGWLVKALEKIKITSEIISKFAKKSDEKSVKNPQKCPSYHGNNWFSRGNGSQYCDSRQWCTVVWRTNPPHNIDCWRICDKHSIQKIFAKVKRLPCLHKKIKRLPFLTKRMCEQKFLRNFAIEIPSLKL